MGVGIVGVISTEKMSRSQDRKCGLPLELKRRGTSSALSFAQGKRSWDEVTVLIRETSRHIEDVPQGKWH